MIPTADKPIATPWSHTAEQVLGALGVEPDRGLDDADVRQRREEFGPNRLAEMKGRSVAAILVDQVKNAIVLLLVAAACVSFLFGERLEAVAIACAILLNVAIGLATEWRATRSMEALRRLGHIETRVRRKGVTGPLDAEEIVPGDVVALESGDIVPADLRLTEASRLSADESALTGESVPVPKETGVVAEEADLANRSNMLYRGTAVTRGSGAGVVVAVGMETELGRIAALTHSSEGEETPLQKRLDGLGHRLVWLTLAVAGVVTAAGLLARRDALTIVETAIALSVAAAPEGLPMVATIALARGMWRMLRRNALVNRLSAVETLGSTTVIFTDKTGTLTENRMAVKHLSLVGEEDDSIERVSIDGESDGPSQGSKGAGRPMEHPAARRVLEVGVLCNSAELKDTGAPRGTADPSGVGDPLELALLRAGRQAGIDRRRLLESHPRTRVEAFDHAVKMMATFHEDDGRLRVAVKGAPERVLEACTRLGWPGMDRHLDPEARRLWSEESERMAADGIRVLGMAAKEVDDGSAPPYEALSFLGLVGLEDPPRRDVPEAVGACARAGIRVVMVTGDHPATAAKIAGRVGIEDADPPRVIEGPRFAAPDPAAPADRHDPLEARVFARVSPKQKLDLVALHQKSGAVVAMTGDGVNDAPALKKADIGIAMGRRGTQVAREAADMVLQDDAFGTIVAAVAQGRAIFENIRKFILFLLSGNVGEILIVGIAITAGAPLPLLPLQILYLNMIGDVFPALALAMCAGESDKMREPPRDADESILTRGHWLGIGAWGLLISGAVLGGFWLCLSPLSIEPGRAVTVSFLSLSFARLWHVFNMRGTASRAFDNEILRNPYIWGALSLCSALLLGAVYLPAMAEILKLVRPTALEWIIILAVSVVPLGVGQPAITLVGRLRQGKSGPGR